MNYYGPKELAASFRTVRKNTIVIAEEIGEEHYGFRATPDTRSIGAMLAHIALVTKMQEQFFRVEKLTTLDGVDFNAFFNNMMAEEQKPRSKALLVAMLRDEGENYAQWLESMTDDYLGQSIGMPAGATPPSKSRFEMILGVKEHEMHHRAQLMVMERLIGIVPHLTREGQARMAQRQASPASAR